MKGKFYFFLAIFWIVIVFTFFMVRLYQEAATIPGMKWEYYSEWGYLHDYYVDDMDTVSFEIGLYEMPDTVILFWTSSYLLFLNKEENDSVLISFDDLKKCFKK